MEKILITCFILIFVSKGLYAQNYKISYFKDDKTNLCFAFIEQKTMMDYKALPIISIAHVPCDKVEKYIKEK